MAPPACSATGTFTAYNITVPIPAGAALGFYCAYGAVTLSFSDGVVLRTECVCEVAVAEAFPSAPGVPRLELTLLSEPAPRRAPGEVAVAQYRVRNIQTSALWVTAIAHSRQIAVRPQGRNESQGVFAMADPFGDDFPIAFEPGANCIPLPPRPYTQAPITNAALVVPANGTITINVGIRSYGQSGPGAGGEATLKLFSATFTDGHPGLACAAMALVVDTSAVSTPCGQAVNDCNHNGLSDALDTALGISMDQNFNGTPDECEQFINYPFGASVSPTNPAPSAPIQVQIAFNEVVPMASVWANGSAMTRTTIGGVPVWQATIPADTRPGPQTVYFLGKDQSGGLSAFVRTYQVAASTARITRIYLDGSQNAIIEHNGADTGRSWFVQENFDLSCGLCWTNRPNGPHASPYNAGPASGIWFFRLHE